MTASAGTNRTDAFGVVYFVQSGQRPLVKIGWTLDMVGRLRQLQCGNPDELTVLGTVDATMADELGWHERFAHLVIRAEWFSLTPELAEAISDRQRIAAEMWWARQPRHDSELDSVDRWIEMIRHARTVNLRRGSASPTSRLDEQKVAAILRDGRSVRAIAADYGVGAMTIHAIKARKSWRHVPMPEAVR